MNNQIEKYKKNNQIKKQINKKMQENRPRKQLIIIPRTQQLFRESSCIFGNVYEMTVHEMTISNKHALSLFV